MKIRTPYVAGIATVAIVAALAAWLARAEPDADGAPSPDARDVAEAAEPDAELAGLDRDDEPARPEPVREAIEAPAPESVGGERGDDRSATTTREDEAAADEAELVVTVLGRGTGAPIADVLLLSRPEGASGERGIEAFVRRPARSPRTDEKGRATLRVPAGIAFRLAARPRAGAAGSIELGIEALAPGERREETLELPVGDDLRIVGRVVAEGDGPLVGATVRFETGGHSFVSGLEHETHAEMATGPDGTFEARVPSWADLRGRVDAAGFGPALFEVAPGYEERERALEIVLRRGATLRGRVTGRANRVDVVVSAPGHELLVHDGGRFPFVGDVTWSTKLVEDGTWEHRDLPASVPLEVELRGSARALRTESGLELEPGEEHVLDWHLGAGATLTGTLRAGGEPLARHEVWLVAESEMNRMPVFWPSTDRFASDRTDAQGRFRFADVGPGTWAVGPAALVRPDEDRVVAVAQRVEILPGATDVDVLIETHRGLVVRGVVLQPSGEPMPRVTVLAQRGDDGLWAAARADEDGAFAVGPLAPGTYEVTTTSTGAHAPSEPVTARAGEEDVVLTLQAGGALSGVTLDGATGEARSAEVSIVPQVPTRSFYPRGVRSDDRGRFDDVGLSPGAYTVTARDDLLVGALADLVVTAGSELRDLEIRLAPGARLAIRHAGSDQRLLVEVRSNAYVERAGVRPGATEERVLPPGDATVRFLRWDAEQPEEPVLLGERTVRLVVGERTEVAWPEAE